jgi:hypothetical protein
MKTNTTVINSTFLHLMASPPKWKSLCRGTDVPQRLPVETLPATWFHTLAQKVRVILKVNRVTELS